MNAVVFGAGKIARGFIGQLLYQSGAQTTFIDVNEKLIKDLRSRGKYYVNVMGNPEGSQWITGFRAVTMDDSCAVKDAIRQADVLFTAVGGKNLPGIGKKIAEVLNEPDIRRGMKRVTCITCENWKDPGKVLAGSIRENGDEMTQSMIGSSFGVTEAAILRSGVEPAKEVLSIDRNAVSVTDYWELPVDADRWVGDRIDLKGIIFKKNFGSFLQQKIYTFNTSNATIAYTGALKGYRNLADAANDPEIVGIVHGVMGELNPAICQAMHVSPDDQKAFAKKAQKKYQDRNVTDYIERHARDPIRKLGPDDRIVGSARLIESCGQTPGMILITLAAALYYSSENPSDPSAAQLEEMRNTEGIEAVLRDICGISPDEKLFRDTLKAVEILKKKGWIRT